MRKQFIDLQWFADENNNLTDLIPDLYDSMDIVSREMIGVIPAASRNASADAVAIGQKLRVPIANPRGTQNIKPGQEPVGSGDDFDNVEIEIQKMKTADPIVWDGDQESSQGRMLDPMVKDQITQAMRSLANEIEADLALEGVVAGIGAGNVYGQAGVTPFAGTLGDMAQIRRILNDMGAPKSDRQFVANSVAAANLLSVNNLIHAEKSGGDTELRQGIIRPIMGLNIWESGGFNPIDAGDATGYLVNGAAGKGAKQVFIDTGSGAFKRGNIITFGSDKTNYVVAEDVASGGTVLTIVGGLRNAVADNTPVNIQEETYLPSIAFHRNALVLVCRPPKLPRRGDKALDVTNIVDPVSGLAYQAALYGDYMQNRLEIRSAWGWKAVSPRHILTLFG
jgi:hypothetical protein